MKLQEEVYFQERTNSFRLSVAVRDEGLIIKMNDFVDWTIYQRKYSEEDIGKQISRKMELIDVFVAFALTKQHRGEGRMKGEQHQNNLFKKYEFGTVVESVEENLPCYKIERGGRITVYLSMFDKRVKKDVTYESMLMLDKIRDMAETEIQFEKSTNEKNHTIDELKKQIQKEKSGKKELLKQVIKLQEENDRLKEELRITRWGMLEKSQKLVEKISDSRSNEFHEFIEKYNEPVTGYYELMKRCDNTLNETQKVLRKSRMTISEATKIISTFTKWSQAHSDKFQMDGLKLEYLDQGWTQYIFNEPIYYNQTATFKIRIIKTKQTAIMVGVVDYARQKEHRSSYVSGNAMCYYGATGHKFPQGIKEENGFKQGDIVEVQTNRATSTIRYIINGITKAIHPNNMLSDSSRVFMPYVEMHDTNDIVQWVP